MISSRSQVKVSYEMRGSTRIKTFAVHPTYNWVGLITASNVFWLVDYVSGMTLKCFNCCTLDQMKPTEVREILFWDDHTCKSLASSKEPRPKSWIVFCCDRRIFLYNYVTYLTKVITEKELDFKSVRKVEVVSEDSLCLAMTDGPMKIFDVQQWQLTKTIKGYHSKTVNWILPYKQNESERPRIVASSLDSLMACWNVDLATATIETPSFKFLMKKSKAVDSNEGQEILSLRYDQHNFRLITLTDEYITFWSSLSGAEVKRFRNSSGLKDIDLLNHFDFPADTFLGHCRGEEVVVATVGVTDKAPQSSGLSPFEAVVMFSQKDPTAEDSRIARLQTIAGAPCYLYLNTASGFAVFELNRLFKGGPYGSHNFSTKLSIANHRQFYADGVLNQSAVTPYKLNSMQFNPDELYNFFFLSFERGFGMLNLVETRLSKRAVGRLQMKLFEVTHPYFKGKVEPSVSADAQLVALWSDLTMYFEVHIVQGPTSQLIELENTNKLDFYSKLQMGMNGLCTAIAWHHHKSEFAVLAPVSEKGELVRYRPNKFELDSKIAGYAVCLYALTERGFELFFKKEVVTELHFLSGGPYFSYSVQDKTAVEVGQQPIKLERLEFIESEETTIKVISPTVLTPLRVYWDEAGEVCVLVYNRHFSLYRISSKGSLVFMRMMEYSLIEGYFWERLFFFSTGQSLFALVLLPSEPVVVELAASNPIDSGFRMQYDIFQADYVDSLEGQLAQLPPGQLKLISVVNLSLYLLDSHNQLCVLPISNPFLMFCMEVVSRCFASAEAIYLNSDPTIRVYFDEMLRMHDLSPTQLKA